MACFAWKSQIIFFCGFIAIYKTSKIPYKNFPKLIYGISKVMAIALDESTMYIFRHIFIFRLCGQEKCIQSSIDIDARHQFSLVHILDGNV